MQLCPDSGVNRAYTFSDPVGKCMNTNFVEFDINCICAFGDPVGKCTSTTPPGDPLEGAQMQFYLESCANRICTFANPIGKCKNAIFVEIDKKWMCVFGGLKVQDS